MYRCKYQIRHIPKGAMVEMNVYEARNLCYVTYNNRTIILVPSIFLYHFEEVKNEN